MDADQPERTPDPPKGETPIPSPVHAEEAAAAPAAPVEEPETIELPTVQLPKVESTTLEGAVVTAPKVEEAKVEEAQVEEAKAAEPETVHVAEIVQEPVHEETPRIESKPAPSVRQEIAAVVVEAEVIPEARAEIVDEIPADATRSDPPGAAAPKPEPSRPAPRREPSRPAPPASEPRASRPRVRVTAPAAPVANAPMPIWQRLWRQPAALMGLLAGCYALVTYVSASKAASDRQRVNAGLVKVEELGERVAREMAAAPIAELKDLHQACSGKLPQRNAENAVLAYAAGPAPELGGKLGPRSRELPSHEVIGSRGGELDFVPVSDTSQVDTLDLWTELLATKPWHWDAAIAHRAHRGPATGEMQHLIVSLVRDASPPRLLSEFTFEGGTSLQQVRIVNTAGAAVCEGLLTTRISTPTIVAATKPSTDDVLVVFGASREAETKYATHLRLAPIKSQCYVTGDSTFCHSIERAVNQ